MPKKSMIKLAAAITAASAGAAFAACPVHPNVSSPSDPVNNLLALEECAISGVIAQDLTLTSDKLWVIQGKTSVGDSTVAGATATDPSASVLTIQAGTIIVGDDSTVNPNNTFTTDSGDVITTPAPDYLIVARGSRIEAAGTAQAPITFTSAQAISGGIADSGQWGGLYLNGYGLNNGCKDAVAPAAPTGACTRSGEADTGTHGGNDNADNSGTLQYVTVAYAGGVFSPESDLNGIAFQSVGSNTTVDHIQVHANVDDGVEMYGGAVNLKNVVLTDNGDDSFDSTEGWGGKAQYVVIYQSSGSDRAFESDNNKKSNNASPTTDAIVSNVTVVSSDPGGADGLKVRRGSLLGFGNLVMDKDSGTCFDLDDSAGDGNPNAPLWAVTTDCAGLVTDKPESDTWIANSPGQVSQYTSSLNGYINGSAEVAAAVYDMNTVDSFFDTTTFSGAVQDCANDWTLGWTVNGTLPAVDQNACIDSVAPVNVPIMGWAGLAVLFGGLVGISRMTRRVK